MPNTREIAFEVLYKTETDKAYSNLALNNALKENNLTGRDASFASALIYGVLERNITLDYIIRQFTNKTPLRKIEKKVLLILRLGFYQLIFMDKVPDNAAVNESVKLAKAKGLYRSSGFINAVLRAFIRADKKYKMPEEKNTVEYLCVKHSCPKEIVSLWLDDYGYKNTLGILENLSGRPSLTIRVNTLKTSKKELIEKLQSEDVEVQEIPFLENALNIENTGSLERLTAFADGDFYVQDSASQLCVEFLNPKPGQTVLDVCSAPGGKSIACALKMENNGRIIACDIYEHKLSLINASTHRLGINIIETYLRDAESKECVIKEADCVLCDVPCAGLGIIRRKPEIRYKTDTIIDNLSKFQYDVLCNSSNFVKVGGILLYSTCSLSRKENNNNADRFLEEHKNFKPLTLNLPDGISRGIDEPQNQLTLFEHICNTDGFFIAAFVRSV